MNVDIFGTSYVWRAGRNHGAKCILLEKLGVQDVMKQQEMRRTKGKRTKKLRKEKNATETATNFVAVVRGHISLLDWFFEYFGNCWAHQTRLQPF